MSERDLLIGVITGDRTWDDIKVWYKSARATGFTGQITLLVYGPDERWDNNVWVEMIHKDNIASNDLNFEIKFIKPIAEVQTLSDFMTYRFKWIYEYLNTYRNHQNVCITDVNDVVFQGDWSKNIGWSKVCVGGENLKYADEPWSRQNMLTCYGVEQFANIRDEEILCAGVIVGQAKYVRALCYLTFAIAKLGKPSTNGGGPDQAAMNIILREANLGNLGEFIRNDLIVHLGTHSEAIKAGAGDVGLIGMDSSKFVYPEISIGALLDLTGEPRQAWEVPPVEIVHQYTRIPYLKEFFRNKYA